ncbi:MAG: hypothetical protein QNJ55_07070 [Xenococcus sp. MO_188.B8]|nr:hypothetical protein [Xenococcus sp. MO_188.B8]
MSDSPWSGSEVFKQIQTEIKERPELQVREEWLLIREEHDGTFTFSLSNAAPSTSIEQLALWRSLRYFAERTDPRC